MTGTVLGPDMEPIPLDIEQTAPGRYVGEFDSAKPGSYMIMVTPGGEQAMIRTGVNIGYSDEFRDRETNTTLLESIAKLPAKDGEPGKLLPPLPEVPDDSEQARASAAAAVGGRSVPPRFAAGGGQPGHLAVARAGWRAACFSPMCSSAACRSISAGWCRFGQRFAEVVLRRERQEAAPETMSRLRSRKAEVDRSIESRRAAARFEPDAAIAGRSERDRSGRSETDDAGPAPAAVPKSAAPKPKRRRHLHLAAAEGEETSLARPRAKIKDQSPTDE